MKETYKIEKLEDMPKYVPIIFIKDNGMKNSKPRMVGNDIHDSIVIEPNGTHLYYYNLQCGESSHDCSDFRFVKREATCYDDEFYSRFCQKVDLEELIAEHDKELKDHIYDLNNKLLNLQLFLKDLRDSFHKEDEVCQEIDKKLKELEQ